jgi:hypothetical protein
VPPDAAASFYAQPYAATHHSDLSQSKDSHARPQSPAEQRSAVLTIPPPQESGPPRINRRKHARVKVSYTACVRHADRGDDIVTCDDMSRGGIRFKSRQRYYDRTLIEVAVPYTPGAPAIFVPAQIVFVHELPGEQLFRYGVAYLQLAKPRDSF